MAAARLTLAWIACVCACASRQPAPPADLRSELVEMGRIDQAIQMDPTANPDDDGHNARIDAVFQKNARRLAAILRGRDWPSSAAVGEEAEKAAFLIVQHADFDLSLQRRALDLLRVAVEHEGAPREQLAYLTDRVRKNEGRPQVYGTQLVMGVGRERIRPVEDEAHLDARRAAVGLDPVDGYIARVTAFEHEMAQKLFGDAAAP